MWQWIKSETVYYVLAIKECRYWKGYQAMMRLSRLARIMSLVLFGGIGVVTVIKFLLPYLPKLTWSIWLSITLLALLLVSISVIHFLGRSYDRAMCDAKRERESEAKAQKEYAERSAVLIQAIAAGRALYDQLNDGQLVSAERLTRWRADTVSDLGICFGNDTAIQFYGKGHNDPPTTETEQRAWLSEYVNRLGSLNTNLQASSNSRIVQI
jgi:hypothetical protein